MVDLPIKNGDFPWLIDGLPMNSMVIFHGYVSHNQMVYTINDIILYIGNPQ